MTLHSPQIPWAQLAENNLQSLQKSQHAPWIRMEMAIAERFTTEKAKCVLTWFSAPLRLYRDIQQDSKLSVACLSFPQNFPSENNYLVVSFLTQEELKHCSELWGNIHPTCKNNRLCMCMLPRFYLPIMFWNMSILNTISTLLMESFAYQLLLCFHYHLRFM